MNVKYSLVHQRNENTKKYQIVERNIEKYFKATRSKKEVTYLYMWI